MPSPQMQVQRPVAGLSILVACLLVAGCTTETASRPTIRVWGNAVDIAELEEHVRPRKERLAKCVIDKTFDDPNPAELSQNNIYRFILACDSFGRALRDGYTDYNFSPRAANSWRVAYENALVAEVHRQVTRGVLRQRAATR